MITTGSHEKGFHREPMSNRRKKKPGKLLKARENADVWLVHNVVRVFFDQSHTEVYENRSPPGLLSTFERKLLDACSYIWTGSASIGTNLSVFQLCKPRIGFLFLKIFFRFFFPPRQVLLLKISQSVPILKVFTVHFSEIWNCFLRGYFCLRRGEDCWVLHYIIHHFYRLDPCWQIFSTNERARISTVIIKMYI